ncbi:MAG: lycopene cyclase domain-containing protein [Elusimicrobia bacterium]|nr:lycopene cyclase domain-containing protein [Elusimicrobiota bacterium]
MPRYFLMTLIVFWIPVFVLGRFLWKKLDPLTKKAFWATMAIMTVATFIMEYVYIWLDIWSFSEQVDPLLGIWLWGVPIEEFIFWFGASPLFIFMYMAFDRFFKRRKIYA